ncbi:MAG: ABC transporter permease [Desulfofustis sp.]|nr:ABC transporter permease [Desulfofustis sp.]NNK55787.1 ABC transporter permease [Desulfofustis sp.]RZW21410.1 MAG: ABC transporter permease [Desulfobulbaceae bacterium]
MATTIGWLKVGRTEKSRQVSAGGFWTIDQLSELQPAVDRLKIDGTVATDIDFKQIERMDTAGACLAVRLLDRLEVKSPQQVHANEAVDSIMATVLRYKRSAASDPAESNALIKIIERIGKATLEALDLTACFVVFIGNITRHLLGTVGRPVRFRFSQTMTQIELSGFNAIPIISLISFLIGIVIAYQGALQLGKLGADIYTIDLLAVTILREMGILLAAVVIAGRSGSTFAAEIGSMKLNEELDAMHTIGMNPMEVLVLPRLIGLTLSLPILTLIANFFGVIGGGLMVWLVMDISPTLFVIQFINSLSPWTFWIGIMKAPVFAAVIAVIGCYEGMQVSGSAESLGAHTTRAVVESIFLIIVFDALFSIFFGVIGI